VWVPEEKKAYHYWGEENTINLSTAYIVPEFKCASLAVDTATVAVGGQVRVIATIWNYGDAAGDDTVNLLNDGAILDTRRIRLAANSDTFIVFTLTAQAAGAHVVSIDNSASAFFVTGSSAVASPGPVPHSSFQAEPCFTIRIFDMRGRMVQTVQSDREGPAAAFLPKECARGLYIAQVYRGLQLTKSKVVFK
jgi:hypothetical protein